MSHDADNSIPGVRTLSVDEMNQILFKDPFNDFLVNKRTRLNARFAEAYESMNNGDLLKSVNYAKFHGVMWYLGKFEAQVWDDSDPRKEGHPVYLGGFDDENMAARAYDLAALKIKGASTTLNFPVTDYEKEIEEMKDVSKDEHLKLLKKMFRGLTRRVSQYRGVICRRPSDGNPFAIKWGARLERQRNSKEIYLGIYGSKEAAARAHDIVALKVNGKGAITNFDIREYDLKKILECPILPLLKGSFRLKLNIVLQDMSNENQENSPAVFDVDEDNSVQP